MAKTLPWLAMLNGRPEFSDQLSPAVSIVIPAYGESSMTLRCLHAIARAQTAVTFEVILVDDASLPALGDALGTIAGLKLLRMTERTGFVGTANAGAQVARGAAIVFLNNDTVVCDGWLDALWRRLRSAGVGLVGAQLVSPDGSVQEAGGIIWRDGSATNYGRGAHPEAPAVSFSRPVDYCSGACLMIRRELITQLGGFDERFAPGYYEDVDLAFRVHERGLAVVYEPQARVYHVEGGTAGTDLTVGMKRFQERNCRVFGDKWAHRLPRQPTRETGPWMARTRGAGKVCLVVDRHLPTPSRDAGSLRIVSIVQELRRSGWQVALAAFDLVDAPEQRRALEALGVEVLRMPYVTSISAYLRDRGSQLGCVILSRLGVARRLVDDVKRHSSQALVIFDTVDVRSLRESRQAELHDDGKARKAAVRTCRQELAVTAATDATLVTSPVERDYLSRQDRGATIAVVPTSYPLVRPQMEFERRAGALFVGGFKHAPNLDGVLWLLDEVWPRVQLVLPGFQLHVVGEDPPQELYRRANNSVQIHGYVEDISAFFERTRMSVAPLRFGAGIKGKVHQSMACGLPCIATPIAAEGMGLMPDLHAVLAEGANDFAEAMVRLNSDRDLWQRLSVEGQNHVQKYFSEDVLRAGLQMALSVRR